MDNNTQMAITPIGGQVISTQTLGMEKEDTPEFIQSNTEGITYEGLKQQIIPTFGDGNLTLAHTEIIDATMRAATKIFGPLTPVDIRVSHRIQGRVPEAQGKATSELKDEDLTTFYQRMAFICHVEGLTRTINGQEVHLCIGGTRSYHEDRLFGRQTPNKLRLFVGWFVKVCTNGMLTCSGNSGILECMTGADVEEKAIALFSSFNPEKEENLKLFQKLGETRISEGQFCSIIGRLRLYQAFPTAEQNTLPKFTLGDSAVNKIVQGYVSNKDFGLQEGEADISLWQLLQLFNEGAKQTAYIDVWQDRNQNATDFVCGIEKALLGEDHEGYSWFLH